MARIASIQVGGFFKTPDHIMDRIVPFFKSGNTSYTSDRIVMDVCAGEGDAIRCLAKHVRGKVYAVEMEATRYKTLESKKNYSDKITQGDFFSLYTTYSYYGKEGGHILYLNPPYDLDKEHGRLEERFLKKATPLLREDGWLVFVVPYYALKASAETFSRYYTDLRLYKFPDEDFGVYKQVVLFARKVSSPFPDDRVSAQILSWSESLDGVAILPTVEEGYNHAPIDIGNGTCGIETWRCVGLDTSSLSGMDPWKGSTVHIAPDVNYQRTYPVASMPRASHLAAAMAAGIFNGFQVSPTGSDSLPPLLVKGVFDREWRKVEDKINNKGEKTAEVQVQAPKLSVCYMDLTTGKFGEVKAVAESRLDPTVEDLSMGDLMEYYGPSLMRGMLDSCPVLYDPKRDGSPTPIEGLARPLYQAQAEAVETILRMHDRDPQEGVVLMGEIGVGKCLQIGTPVIKYEGSVVAVEDIKEGDLLMGPDSLPRRVAGTTRGIGELYKITPIKGDPWVCNDAHILTLVHTMSDDVFDIPLQEYIAGKRIKRNLSKGGRTTHPVGEFKQFFPAEGVSFPPIPEPDIDPYFLGVWYGDGNKRLKDVGITSADQEIVSMVYETATKYSLSVRIESKEDNKASGYFLSKGPSMKNGRNNILLDKLRTVYGDGLRLPTSCLLGSFETRRSFMAGLIDSDGHLNRFSYDFVQIRKEWSEDMCFLARSLGIRATMKKSRKSDQNGTWGTYWRVILSGDLNQIPTRLVRKQAPIRSSLRRNKLCDTTYTRRTRNANRTGINISPIGVGEYAGFTLDGDGRFLLGDFTVTHNTGVSLSTAKALNIKKLLVVCPPHLLTGWGDQVKASVKDAESIVLDTISDIRRWQASTASMAVGIMSRERAKLSHGWIPVERACPKCGGPLPTGKDLVKTRATCAIEYHKPKNKTASWVADIAYELASFKKGNAVSAALLSKRALGSVATVEYTGPSLVHDKLVKLVPLMGEGRRSLLPFLCWADRNLIPLVLDTYYPVGTELDLTFYEILLMADAEVADTYKDRFDTTSYYGYASGYIKHRKFLSDTTVGYGDYSFKEFSKGDDGIKYHSMMSESIEALDRFVQKLTQMSSFSNTVCGEFLYQAVPSPDRYPLAKWITKFAKDSFDMLIFDEAHEGSSPDSAQTKAVQRLMGANKAFKLLLTGSIMNGYAGSLFMNMRAISKKFKADFGMDAQTKFIDRYGYWKRVVSETDNAGKIVEWGSQSDRTMSSKRAGEAPGILPVFQLEYLLPNAVTLQKVDLKLNIPPCTEHVHDVEPTSLQESNYRYLLSELMDTIKATRYKPGLAGKLWGAMANLPGYLDLAASGEYELRWPDNCPDVGGSLIASVPSLDPDELLPKEDWMLSQIALSLSEGHRPMVLGWHTALLPRYLKIIEDAGYDVVWLDASKVGTAKRQDWIDKHVIKAKCQVLVVNPVVIQTGLNNLVYFSRQIWMENPVCNPITYRQAGGRIDRIGQTQDTEIHFPRYSNTAQIQAHKLLLHKVGVSQAVDGLDPEEALKSAGMIDSDFNGFSVGKQLYRMVCEG